MYPTTNTRRKTVMPMIKIALGVIAIIAFFGNRFTIFGMLTHTRSSGDVENTAPFMAFIISAIVCGWVAVIIINIVVCLRLPKRSHWNADWLKQDRRDMRNRLVSYVMVSAIVGAYTAGFLVHQFG